MSWIMLIKKLPTVVSPPRLSIFWSEVWPRDRESKQQQDQLKRGILEDYGGDCYWDSLRLKEPRFDESMKIMYKDEAIRVFPHEFSVLTSDRMNFYLEEGAYDLVAGTVAEADVIETALNGVKRVIFEEAVLDGCTDIEARLMAMGIDVSQKYEIPPIGWYKIKREAGLIFCSEYELEETDRRAETSKQYDDGSEKAEYLDKEKTIGLVGHDIPSLRKKFLERTRRQRCQT